MCEIWYDYVKGQNMCRLNTMLSQTTYKFNPEVEVTLFIYSLIINRNITKLKNKIKELSKSYNIKYITYYIDFIKAQKAMNLKLRSFLNVRHEQKNLRICSMIYSFLILLHSSYLS